jgi:predicted nuclease of predicted toxin-antitoxin system
VATLRSPLSVWVDAQLPPALAKWLRDLGESGAVHVEDLGLLQAEDPEIFTKARQVEAVVITKDSDFVQILERRGPPPQVVWVTCGNRSNPALKDLIVRSWPHVKELLIAGEALVEISQVRDLAINPEIW